MTGCACVTGRRQRRDRTRVFPDWRRGPAVMVALRRDGKPRQIPMPRTLSAIAAGGRPAAIGCWSELAWASGLAGAWAGNAGRVPARIPPGRQRPDAPTYLLLRSGCPPAAARRAGGGRAVPARGRVRACQGAEPAAAGRGGADRCGADPDPCRVGCPGGVGCHHLHRHRLGRHCCSRLRMSTWPYLVTSGTGWVPPGSGGSSVVRSRDRYTVGLLTLNRAAISATL